MIKIFKKYWLTYILFFVTIYTGWMPWLLARTDDGGTEGPFALGIGARALGMGRAFVAISDDATALYWNPAGLSQLKKKEITALHTNLFMDTVYQFAGFACPTERSGNFGVGLIRINTPDIIQKDAHDNYISTFFYEEREFLFSYARQLPYPAHQLIYGGITMKMDTQQIADYYDTGVGLDFALMSLIESKQIEDTSWIRWTKLNNLSLGINLQNLAGARIRLKEETDVKPLNVKFGIKGDYHFFRDRDRFTWTIEFNKPVYRTVELRLGTEYWYRELIAVRSGLDQGRFTCGVGISYADVQFDYALSSHELSSMHRFSFTVRFAPPKKEVGISEEKIQYQILQVRENMDKELNNYKEELSKTMMKEITEYKQKITEEMSNLTVSTGVPVTPILTEKVKEQTAEHLERVKKYLQSDMLIEALEELNGALRLDPTNTEAQKLFVETNKKLAILAHLAQGMTFFEEEDYVAAMTEFEAILKLKPEHEIAKKYYQKSRSFVTPTKIPTEKISELYYKGINYYIEGQFEQAITVWEEILKTDPYNKNALKNIEKAKERMRKLHK